MPNIKLTKLKIHTIKGEQIWNDTKNAPLK